MWRQGTQQQTIVSVPEFDSTCGFTKELKFKKSRVHKRENGQPSLEPDTSTMGKTWSEKITCRKELVIVKLDVTAGKLYVFVPFEFSQHDFLDPIPSDKKCIKM